MMQVDEMRRLSAGSAAATWPLAAPAQQPTMPVIGYVGAQSPCRVRQPCKSFPPRSRRNRIWRGSKCRNRIRWAEGQHNRLSALAADLAGRQVAVIVAPGGAPAALAAEWPSGARRINVS